MKKLAAKTLGKAFLMVSLLGAINGIPNFAIAASMYLGPSTNSKEKSPVKYYCSERLYVGRYGTNVDRRWLPSGSISGEWRLSSACECPKGKTCQ